MKKIVVIGGGTGTFTVLSGLKKYPQFELSAIVSMMDSGGSNRVIRDEFGLLPTSDIRQVMVALASNSSDRVLRKLFTYRYSKGKGISGMTFGNLFMAALSDIYKGDQRKAIEETCKILNVSGDIIPVTYDKTDLVATYANGNKVSGEHNIDEPKKSQGEFKITQLEVVPSAKANKDAITAISDADYVILGPGDFYTSTLSNVVVGNISSALKKTRANIIFIVNLMTKFGETNGFKATDFIYEIKKYIGRAPDVVIIDNSDSFPEKIIEKYKTENARPVEDDLGADNPILKDITIIRKKIVSDRVYSKAKSDILKRSLIRHDSVKLARVILEYCG